MESKPSKEALEAASEAAAAAELKLVREERDNYAKWLNETGRREYQGIQENIELKWELNYAVHCVTENEELRKKLTRMEDELRGVKKERDRFWGELNQHRISTEQYAKEFAALRAANDELKQSLATEAHESNAAILRLQQANTDLVEVMQEIRDRPDISALSMRLLATNVLIRLALDKRVECARCVELAGVLRGLLKNAERDGDTRLAVQKALSVLARHAVGEPAKHPDTERP